MRKTGLNGFVYDFAVDYRALDISDITNIHEYLINMIWNNVWINEKKFIRLLTSIVSVSYHTKYMSLGNQKCMIQPTLINLHPNEFSQELNYYPFAVNRTYSRNLWQHLILVRMGTFLWKKGPTNVTSPLFNPFSKCIASKYQNKVFHNFCKRGQHSIVECHIGLEYALVNLDRCAGSCNILNDLAEYVFQMKQKI